MNKAITIIIYALIIIFICHFGHLQSAEIQKRVIRGRKAYTDEIPWAASLIAGAPNGIGFNFCGATIIGKTWLLTASHCFQPGGKKKSALNNPKVWHVQAGNKQIDLYPTHYLGPKWFDEFNSMNGYQRPVMIGDQPVWHAHIDRIILHPKYKPDKLEYDIALVHLRKALPLGPISGIWKATLPPRQDYIKWPPIESVCEFAGWGCLRNNGKPSSSAHIINLEVVPYMLCHLMYKGRAGLNENHEFCAGYYNDSKGVCSGDSGGGLIFFSNSTPYVVGVASATHAKHPEKYPGVFTRVSYFQDWILSTIKKYDKNFKL